MGCDIHMYMEIRKAGVWEIVKEFSCFCCKGSGELPKHEDDGDHKSTCYFCNGSGTSILHKEFDEEGSDVYYWSGGHPYSGRNYTLFQALADVRRYGNEWPPCLIPERGIPEDCSLEYKEIADNVDYHSHSWLDYDEVAKMLVVVQHDDHKGYFSDFAKHTVCGHMKSLADRLGPENVRLVFCFDN